MILQTIPFKVNLTETDLKLKYPDLVGVAYVRNIVLDNVNYIIKISFNNFSNSPVFNLLNENETALIQNVMMTPAVNDIAGNLLNMKGFQGYVLVWDTINGLVLRNRILGGSYEGI